MPSPLLTRPLANHPFDYAHSTGALVTGASRGIGAEIARELARRGAPNLALVARTGDDLETLASELRAQYGTRVEVIVADLADPEAPDAIRAATDRAGIAVDLLVNNAGFGDHGAFDQRPLPKQREMMSVNIVSLVALTGLYLPDMVQRGGGAILNVASTAAFQPVPYMASYGATKAFVLSFSEALWAENEDRQTGVRVVCLCPGGTETNFGAVATDGSAAGRGNFERFPSDTAEDVAKAGLNALDGNASFAVVGAANYVGTLGARLMPRGALARMTSRLFRPADVAAAKSEKAASADTAGKRRTVVAGAAVAASVAAVGVLVAVRAARK